MRSESRENGVALGRRRSILNPVTAESGASKPTPLLSVTHSTLSSVNDDDTFEVLGRKYRTTDKYFISDEDVRGTKECPDYQHSSIDEWKKAILAKLKHIDNRIQIKSDAERKRRDERGGSVTPDDSVIEWSGGAWRVYDLIQSATPCGSRRESLVCLYNHISAASVAYLVGLPRPSKLRLAHRDRISAKCKEALEKAQMLAYRTAIELECPHSSTSDYPYGCPVKDLEFKFDFEMQIAIYTDDSGWTVGAMVQLPLPCDPILGSPLEIGRQPPDPLPPVDGGTPTPPDVGGGTPTPPDGGVAT